MMILFMLMGLYLLPLGFVFAGIFNIYDAVQDKDVVSGIKALVFIASSFVMVVVITELSLYIQNILNSLSA